MRHGLMAFAAMFLGTTPVVAQEWTVSALDGIWQLADVLAVDDPARPNLAQPGRLIQLDSQSLVALDGAGCAGPMLRPLAEMPQQAGAAVTQAMLTRIGSAIASEPSTGALDGVAGYCLGELFAVYVPQADGSLLVADRVALYRLRPPANEANP